MFQGLLVCYWSLGQRRINFLLEAATRAFVTADAASDLKGHLINSDQLAGNDWCLPVVCSAKL